MKTYLQRLENTSTLKFIIILALAAFLVKIPAGILGTVLIDTFDLSNPLFSSSVQEPTFTYDDIFLAIIFAPLFETLFSQAMPIALIKMASKSTLAAIIGSSTIFMMLHFPVIEFFPSAFTVGLIFAWAWVVKLPQGKVQAFWIVTLIHSLHNAIVIATAAVFL